MDRDSGWQQDQIYADLDGVNVSYAFEWLLKLKPVKNEVFDTKSYVVLAPQEY